MAVRQYIGARYVPRFSDVNNGVWSNVYEYEPLTIVKHGNDYYTSRQTVPVGTDILNTDYWLMTGNYNGAITELGNRIDDVNDALTLQHNAITNRNLKVILVGDSYGTRNGSGSTVLLSDVGDELRSYMARMNGTVYNVSQNGAGFCNGRFLANLQTQRNAMSDVEAGEVTDVFVFGGWNDTIGRNGQTVAQLRTAQGEFSSYCLANFPNARMHLAFVSYTAGVSSEADGLESTFLYYSISYSFGFIFHDLHNIIASSTRVVSDLSHPNADGVTWIARGIYECVAKGNMVFNLNLVAEITSTNFTFAGNHYFNYYLDENGVQITPYTRYLSNMMRVGLASGHSESFNIGVSMNTVDLLIGTIPNYFGNAGRRLMMPISGSLAYVNTEYPFTGSLYADGNDVHMLITNVTAPAQTWTYGYASFNIEPSGKVEGVILRT